MVRPGSTGRALYPVLFTRNSQVKNREGERKGHGQAELCGQSKRTSVRQHADRWLERGPQWLQLRRQMDTQAQLSGRGRPGLLSQAQGVRG